MRDIAELQAERGRVVRSWTGGTFPTDEFARFGIYPGFSRGFTPPDVTVDIIGGVALVRTVRVKERLV